MREFLLFFAVLLCFKPIKCDFTNNSFNDELEDDVDPGKPLYLTKLIESGRIRRVN